MDDKVTIKGYVEPQPRRLLRIVWRLASVLLWMMPNKVRVGYLRLFGAKLGVCCHVYPSVRIYAPWNLTMGEWTCVGPHVEIYNKGPVVIGSETVISQDAYICTASHDISSPRMALVTMPITIGSHVWIAAKATILPGVAIGDGAVVGACAVVGREIPAWRVVVGNPAVIKKERSVCA